MTLPTKPPVRADVWADQAANPTTDVVDPGNAFVAAGWVAGNTPPARAYFNWFMNYVMNGVRYFCRRGISDWDAAETYQQYDVVMCPDGIVRQSQTSGNVGNNPETDGVHWSTIAYYATTAFVTGFYVSIASLASTLASYVTNSSLAATLASYVTSTYLAANYVSNSSFAEIIANYVTNASLAATLASYATQTYVAGQINTAINEAEVYANGVANTATNNAEFYANGVAASAQANAIAAAESFASSLITSGSNANGHWIKFPGGVIIQSGETPNDGGNSEVFNFPIPFPNVCNTILATAVGAFSTIMTSQPGASKTQFTLNLGSAGNQCSWVAIGS